MIERVEVVIVKSGQLSTVGEMAPDWPEPGVFAEVFNGSESIYLPVPKDGARALSDLLLEPVKVTLIVERL